MHQSVIETFTLQDSGANCSLSVRLKTLAESFRGVPLTTSDMGLSRCYINAHGFFYFL